MPHPPSSKRTAPLTVANTGFMLDRLGRDCAPLQFLRELTQNSIEAILRTPEKEGEIRWDVDWNRFDLAGDGIFKLAVIDTGDGMTGPDMVRYINQLSSSINPQSHQGNWYRGQDCCSDEKPCRVDLPLVESWSRFNDPPLARSRHGAVWCPSI